MLLSLFLSLILTSTSTQAFNPRSCRDIYDQVGDKSSILNTQSTHVIQSVDNEEQRVRCAFISINDTAVFIGMLFESFTLSQGTYPSGIATHGMFDDYPVNDTNAFRLDKAQILDFHQHDESYLLMTCNFDISMTRDFVFSRFYDEFLWDPDISTGSNCFKVQSANIRGFQCDEQTVNFWSLSNDKAGKHFRIDSSFCHCECCDWVTDSIHSEDNFGFYGTYNPAFSCSASPDSTTNYWIGDVVHLRTCQEIYQASNQSLDEVSIFHILSKENEQLELICAFILNDDSIFVGSLVCEYIT